MKRFTKTALMAVGVALASQGARAQTANPGDLILGFTQVGNTSGNDYVIDLGSSFLSTPGVTVLSGDVSASTFHSTFSFTAGNPVNGGVVGGNNTGGQGTEVWTTTLRSGSNPATSPGTETKPAKPGTQGAVTLAAATPTGVTLGTPSQNDSGLGSWTQQISADPTHPGTVSGSFTATLGNSANPLRAFNPAGNTGNRVLTEDLWNETLPASGTAVWTYQGFFTLDFSGSSPLVTFTSPVAVPEPSTYGILAGAGLLVLSLRRQLKNA
jgi:hypothetical protein